MAKNTILGMPHADFQRKIQRGQWLCVILSGAVLAVNGLCVVSCNDSNYIGMIVANSATDIALCWFLLLYIQLFILPKRRLLKLCAHPPHPCSGVINGISQDTQRIRQFDCYTVQIGDRRAYLPAYSSLQFEVGQRVNVGTVDHIITEAEML